MKNIPKNDDDKRIENGLKKKELEDKYGAVFSDHTDLPLDLENAWLKNVEAFEESFSNAKTTSVFNFIGQPEFAKLSALNDQEISKELDRILDLMQERGVSLDTICEVDEKELYRFITEELMMHEIDDIKIPGMMTCFTYEEFHPNAKLDIEQAIEYFFGFTMKKVENIGGEGYDLLYIDTESYLNNEGQLLDRIYVEKTINNFLDSFDSFEFSKNDTLEISVNNEETRAIVKVDVAYKAYYNNSREWNEYQGIAHFKLRPSKYGGWSIYNFNIPGLVL